MSNTQVDSLPVKHICPASKKCREEWPTLANTCAHSHTHEYMDGCDLGWTHCKRCVVKEIGDDE